MNFNFLDYFIIFLLILTLVDYEEKKNKLIYGIFLIFLVLNLVNLTLIWDTNLFSLSQWKIIPFFLVLILFFIIAELIEDKSFDIYCLITLVFLGSIILIISDNLITVYLGLELQTFSIFILVAKNRHSIKSSEAGLKYFILGALSSGFFLLGLTILFLNGFPLNLQSLTLLNYNYVVSVSIVLLSLSFCFKISLFPLHFWIPDIYEGSSWSVISLLSTLPKISMIAIISQILINSNLVLFFSIVSIIIGTLGSMNQTKVKRLLGYSGISHMGFIMLGYSILNNNGFVVGNLYLVIYMSLMISLFVLIININSNSKFIIEFSNLKFTSKLGSITLGLLILSVAGIPPLSGFISKWFLLLSTVENLYNISSFVIILFSAIGAGYYLRIVKIIYFQKKSSFLLWQSILNKSNPSSKISLVFLGLLLFINITLLINFSFIVDIINLNLLNIN